MNQISDFDLLASELETVAAQKAEATKRLEELAARESRLAMAMDVLRSVRAERLVTVAVRAAPNQVELSLHDKPDTIASLMVAAAVSGGASGSTSAEIFERISKVRKASQQTLSSVLSRLVKQKLIRKDGKLYFGVLPS